MKRVWALLFLTGGALVLASAACSPGLAQPFSGMQNQPITVLRLQNWEPPQPQASVPGVPGMPSPGTLIPPQIQTWLGGAASAIPPGLIPPGLLPGGAPFPSGQGGPRFYNFRIITQVNVADAKMREQILELFGKESSFQNPTEQCMYPELGFQIGQPAAAGAPQGTPPSGAPADILVSLSCRRVQMYNYGWPYGTKFGLTPDSSAKLHGILSRAFGGG